MASENKMDPLLDKLADALNDHANMSAALYVAELARAVARAEIERAKPSDSLPTVAPERGTTTPGGVRVEWDDHGGPPWVTVDRETLIAALDDYEDTLTQFGYRADRAEARKALAARLGIHLKGGDHD
jgi:hypothetical protein